MIELKKETNNTYRFFVKTGDGNSLLNSISFTSKEDADTTIKQLPPLMKRQAVFERKTDHKGKFMFALKDSSGSVIGTSQRYSSEAGMENGIKNVKKRIAAISQGNEL
ncbi:MAG: YegP family protein [Eudoraea sp.]|nr:YegP family protein [Eudoraea sp.]